MCKRRSYHNYKMFCTGHRSIAFSHFSENCTYVCEFFCYTHRLAKQEMRLPSDKKKTQAATLIIGSKMSDAIICVP